MNKVRALRAFCKTPLGLAAACAGVVVFSVLFSASALAQEQFFTQSGGRGLQNAKTNARLAKVEGEVTEVRTEIAKIKPHAYAELGTCSDDGEKLRWDGSNWICEKETDPTVQGWAKKALPTCTGGSVLSALGGDFICAQSTAITTESDPTVQQWAKNALPSCGSGQSISANGSALVCATDERGLTAELDPKVLPFAHQSTGVVPVCGADEVLTMVNGRLACTLDKVGLTEEVDPRVQNFARTDIDGYSLAACPAGEVLQAIDQGDKVLLACTSASGAVAGSLLLNDLSDVDTAGQTSGTVLMYDNGMWRARTEADPTVPAWAKSTLTACSAGQVLSYDGSTLTCVDDAGGANDPLTLASLSDVNVTSVTTGKFLQYDGTKWVPGNVEEFAQTVLPTCASGQMLTGDGTNLTCVDDAGGSNSPINLVELGDVRTDVNTVLSPNINEFLRWNGTKWEATKDLLTGTLTPGKWCRYVSATDTVDCDITPGTMALQNADDVSITGGLITVASATVTGDLTVRGNLNVSGSQSLDGVLFANGGITMPGALQSEFISSTYLSTTLADIRTGRITDDLYIGGNLFVSGSQSFDGVTFANGGVSSTGTITASAFVGDGSGLTGVPAGDRIVSGTTSVVAEQGSGAISITQLGNATGYFDPTRGLVTLGVSSSGAISGTTGYFGGNVKVRNTLTTDQSELVLEQAGDSLGATRLRLRNRTGLNGALLENSTLDLVDLGFATSGGIGNLRFEHRNEFKHQANSSGEFQLFVNSAYNSSFGTNVNSLGGKTGLGWSGWAPPSQTLHVRGGALITSWTGINFDAADVTPTAPLEVRGMISATDLRLSGNLYVSGTQSIDGVLFANGGVSATGVVTATTFYGDGSNLTGVVAAATDRIVSGTTSMVAVSETGFVSLTQAGTNTGWFDPTRGLVTLGVSATGRISATQGYFTSALNAGTGTFRSGLNVVGTATFSVGAQGDLTITPLASGGTYAVNVFGGTYSDLVLGGDAQEMLRLKRGGKIGMFVTYPSTTVHISGTVAINSWTMVNANKIPTAPLEVSGTISATNITTSGTVYAGQFVGDGSGLTGVVASTADRIVSGTTSMLAVSDTGFVSLTQAGTNTGWFDPTRGLVTLGVSATGGISGTTGYFGGNVGVGTRTPLYLMDVRGRSNISQLHFSSTDADNGGYLISAGANNFFMSAGSAYANGWYAKSTGSVIIGGGAAGADGLFTIYTNTGLSNGNTFTPTERMRVTGAGLVGIGTSNPTTRLEVNGTVSATNIQTSGTVYAGQFVGDGSGLTGVVASTADRIVSGTTSMLAVSDTGFVSLTQAGTNTGWFDPTRGLVTLGVSATGAVSATKGYFGGNVGIGIKTPSVPLEVNGAVKAYSLDVFLNAGSYARINEANIALLNLQSAFNNAPTLKIDNTGSADMVRISKAGTPVFYVTNLGRLGIGTADPSDTFHVNGSARISSWTMVNANTTPTAPLEVSGTISATNITTSGTVYAGHFVGDGSGLTGLASTDRLVSGSAALILSPTGVLNLNGRLELNSGTGIVGIGTEAAIDSRGNYVAALGMNAARYNSGSSVNALGYGAAQDNRGDFVNALGYAAARLNTGSSVNVMGWAAGFGNTGGSVNAFGYSAARYNSGSSVNALGVSAAQNNTGNNVEALGYSAATSNTGSDVVAIGREAAKVNTFSNVVALGYNAQPDKANQIVLGNSSIVEVSTAGVIRSGGLTTSGTVHVSNTVYATQFIGDGSGLTGVVASTADRIVSGTTSMVVDQASGFVSLTQAGTNTGWFDPTRGLVTLGVSSTGGISATDIYGGGNATVLGKVVVGSATTSVLPLMVYGSDGTLGSRGTANNSYTGMNMYDYLGNNAASFQYGNSAAGAFTNTFVLATRQASIGFKIFQGGTAAANERLVITSASTVNVVNASMGIGTMNPSATLDVSGSIKMSGTGSEVCGPDTYGSIRFVGGVIQVCRP